MSTAAFMARVRAALFAKPAEPSTGPYIRQVPGKWEWIWSSEPLRPGGEDS